MRDLKDTFLGEFRIPTINGDRCVHAHIETASCRACVDACPESAWILDDESLGLNTNACDGCGLCVPACTEGAITQTQNCTVREESQGEDKQRVLLLGCEHSGLDESNCKCIHAFSYNDLLNLKRDGIYGIHVSKGDCSSCSRGKNEQLFERVNNVNLMLKARDLDVIHYRELPAEQWRQLWKTPEKIAPGPAMSRRLFLRSAVTQTVDIALQQSEFGKTEDFTPLGEVLPLMETNAPLIYPAVPYINPAKCNGCDACIRTCLHDVFIIQHEESDLSYQTNPAACTACDICRDICNEKAIEIQRWATKKNNPVLLKNQKCKSCGVMFHYPERRDKQDEMCNICSKVNHQKNLFQVM